MQVSYNRKTVTFNFTKFPKSMVPFGWNLKSKLDWLAGLFDGDGCIHKRREDRNNSLQFNIVCANKNFLENVKLFFAIFCSH